MNNDFANKLLKVDFTPFDIENISRDEIIDETIFNYIFTINDEIKKAKLIMNLEEQAKKANCLDLFRKILNEYNNKSDNKARQFTQKEHLKHNEVADKLLQENSLAIYENKLYIYINGVYTEDKKYIEKKIIEIMPTATSYFRKEVYQYLLLNAREAKIDKESGIINFKNGLFDVNDRKLHQHTPNFFSINQINTNYNPNVMSVRAIDDVLDKLSTNNKERKQTILEMIGYCMTTSVKLQKAFILYGETARNGKSTLINIITELIGRENVGNVSFKDMNKNRFAAAGISGKLLNVGSEMADDYLEDVSIFKMFITGDYLEIEEKFKQKQTISPFAKFIFNANALPTVADKTNGFYRRLHIIPLETSFTNKDAENFDFNKLISKDGLEYLAKISLEAFLSMKEQFSNYEESKKEIIKYMISSNSILSFINDKYYIYNFCKKTKKHSALDVHSSYKKYCTENQYRPIGRNKFYKEIEKNKIVTVTEHNKQKYYTFNI